MDTVVVTVLLWCLLHLPHLLCVMCVDECVKEAEVNQLFVLLKPTDHG